jgi:hypothetical protein
MKTLILACFAMMALSSCAPRLSHLTQDLYERNRWTDAELKRIQFYLSDDIVLRRQLGGAASEIVNGKVRVINGQKVDEIIIPNGTPGVFLFSPKANRFAVAFENGSTERYLMFGPNPKAGDRYVLLAKEWDRAEGKVTYDGQEYNVNYGSAFAGLMLDLRRVEEVNRNSRVVNGRRID